MWNLKGIFHKFIQDSTGKYVVFKVEDFRRHEAITEDVVNIEVKKWHKPKTLSANGYYWALCNALSEKLSSQGTPMSTARIHNLHLREIWDRLIIYNDGSPVLDVHPDTDVAEQSILESTTKHLMPVPERIMKPTFTNSNGKTFRYYFELKGSSEMDSKEFARLVDMVIQECKDQDINTEIKHE